MKKLRYLISALVSTSMLLSGVAAVNAETYVGGNTYRSPFDEYASGTNLPAAYLIVHQSGATLDANSDPCYYAYTADSAFVQPRDDFYCSGTRALYIAARNSSGGARFDMHFNVGAESSEYYLSFNRRSNSSDDYRNFVTINTYEWNGGSGGDHVKLSNTSFWTVTEITGADGYTWKHYEATITQNASPKRVMFKAFGWGEHIIDDVCVKDKNGNILFNEDFDRPFEVGTLPYSTGWHYTEGSSGIDPRYLNKRYVDNYCLCVDQSGSKIKYGIALPPVPDNQYEVYYDIAVKASRGAVSLDFSGDDVYGAGRINETEVGTYHKSFTTNGARTLYIAAVDSGVKYLDNIVVKDKYGNVVFTENFDEPYIQISYPKLMLGESERTSLATGTFNVSSSVKNNQIRSCSTYMIVATYDSEDKELKSFNYVPKTIAAGATEDFDVDVPVESGQKLRVFWWEDLNGIKAFRTNTIHQ